METIYRDYTPKGVRFYYVYKQLAHPELNGYIDPIHLDERLAHVAAAQKSLKTEFHWICDNMDNDIKHQMGDAPNSEFIIAPNGKVVIKRVWSNPRQLRADLAKLVGPSEKVTSVDELGYKIDARAKQVAKGVVKRVNLPDRLVALKSQLTANSEGDKYYVKLRAEADQALLDSGSGLLYLAFHLDPIYQVHWNNESTPFHYSLNLPKNAKTETTSGNGPTVDVKADADPREFLIRLESDSKITDPIEVTVKFMICDDAETFCIPMTQTYSVHLERDPELGWRMTSRLGSNSNRARGASRANMIARMKRRDTNGDGKISKEELPPAAHRMFERLDQNDDGFVDEEELKIFGRRR